jgi:hypothetical protein
MAESSSCDEVGPAPRHCVAFGVQLLAGGERTQIIASFVIGVQSYTTEFIVLNETISQDVVVEDVLKDCVSNLGWETEKA